MIWKIVEAFLSTGRWILRLVSIAWAAIKRVFYWLFVALVPLVLVWWVVGHVSDMWEFRDDHKDRGAAMISTDPFDPPVSEIEYLNQGWSRNDSLWFYSATQGSNLLPYDFFLYLQQANSPDYFRSPENLNRYRYLPQVATISNPDGLPVGMAKDTYQGKEYMGFTCSACHTSQINYNNGKEWVGIRIDGGPTAADIEAFLRELALALESTIKAKAGNPEKFKLFYSRVLEAGNYKNRKDIDDDLDKFLMQIKTYNQINEPISWSGENPVKTHYGFGRLDAFGRIFNRVLQYVISPAQLLRVLEETYSDVKPKIPFSDIKAVLEEDDKSNLVVKALNELGQHLQGLDENEKQDLFNEFRSRLFNPANGPVSYPYLWDIPHHDYVQWTGLVSNGGIGPLGRNVGQVIGVFGTLDWQGMSRMPLNTPLAKLFLGNQGFGPDYMDFKSSINKRNLRRVENHLRSLKSPEWPDHIFGNIDNEMADKGEILFNEYCISCHANIDRTDESRRIIVHMGHVDKIGTDPIVVKNTVSYMGYSGLLQNKYVEAGPGMLVLEERSPVASLVKITTQNVVLDWDPDKNAIRRVAEWGYDIVKTLKNNKVADSLKRGDYDPSTTVDPFKSLRAYKARALNGIWATAPYLHNGSIPNLYELLLPHKRDVDPEFDEFGNEIEYRSTTFFVGSRVFNPEKVGFKTYGYKGFLYDTQVPGNSNAGHEYAAGRTRQADGRMLQSLNEVERKQLLEYLKKL